MRSIRRFLDETLAHLLDGESQLVSRPDVAPALVAQQLEERRVLTIGLDSLSPVSGTENINGGWDCDDPTIGGVIQGVSVDHTVRLDFDFDGDGSADDSLTLSGSETTFEYDPRSLVPDLSGAVDLRVKATEFDVDGVTELDSTAWESVQLNVADPTPVVSDLQYDLDSGDNYVFEGTVSGPYAAGATVSLSGPFTAVVTADGSGHFTCTQWLPNGASGILSVDVTDTDGNTASDFMTVDIPDPTLTFNGLTYTQSSGDDYVIEGSISGVYKAGATVSLSGVLMTSITTDANGYFSLTYSFPDGASGFLAADIMDDHGHTVSGLASVEIPDPN